MEGRITWKRTLGIVLGCFALTVGPAGSLHAEMLHCSTVPTQGAYSSESSVARECFAPLDAGPTVGPVDENRSSVYAAVKRECDELRRSALEAMMTMILIRFGTPPPVPQGNGQDPVPPPQGGGETPPPPPPPPPDGGGEGPPIDPPIDPPPPQGTPEPSSLLIAGIGVSLSALVSWRRRLKQQPAK